MTALLICANRPNMKLSITKNYLVVPAVPTASDDAEAVQDWETVGRYRFAFFIATSLSVAFGVALVFQTLYLRCPVHSADTRK